MGQLSAWYVLSALGFSQPCLSVPEYYMNTPLFKEATIKLDKEYLPCKVSDTFKVQCDRNPLEYPFIDEIYLNGKKLERNYITYDESTNGGVLNIYLKK